MRSNQHARRWVRPVVAVIAAVGAAGIVAPAHAASDPLTSKQWGLDLVQARAAWSVGRGAGVTIAVVDSGADLVHEDLAPNLVAGRSFVSDSPQDDDGHGTHVSGIAAGVRNNGLGISGVAPEAKVMPIKVLTPDGGTISDVATGIRLAADSGAAAINLSLGAEVPLVTSFGTTLQDAIRYAWSKGSICVLAAGNNSLPLSDYGDLPAIVVTAVDRNDRKAAYATSIGGARWGMAAPGGAANGNDPDDVLSTFWSSGRSNSYAYLAGTSMAAPFVSGAVAILRGLGLSPQATVDRLLATATDLGASGRDSTFGSGRLDVASAVKGLGAPASGPTPTAANNASPTSPTSPTRSRPPTTQKSGPSASQPTLAATTPGTEAEGDPVESLTPTSPPPQSTGLRSASKPQSAASPQSGSSLPLVAGGFVALMTAATAALLTWRSRRTT